MNCETEFLNYAAAKLDQMCGRIEICIGKMRRGTPESMKP
jgi:hypothetical protein